jgi:hypothetical protein
MALRTCRRIFASSANCSTVSMALPRPSKSRSRMYCTGVPSGRYFSMPKMSPVSSFWAVTNTPRSSSSPTMTWLTRWSRR